MNSNSAGRKIHLLPEHLIDQIKAGEVIERPANILKETLENAIDANADLIKIHLISAGLELIHIEDNGLGISFEDLPLAFCRHATSKISRFDDLYNLHSFGFRGEALASISAISKVSCYSTTNDESSLFQIEGARTIAHEKLNPSPQLGTSLFIRDLFYNTPVRMKFLQSGSGELNKLKKTIHSFLLNRPDIAFHIKWDQLDKIVYPKSTHAERFKILLGEKKGHEIKLHFHQEQFDEYELIFYFSHQTQKSSLHREQYIFINNRNIVDKQIHNLILRGLAPIWGNDQGSYCLFLKLNPEEIDVNVHPNKTVIKIHQSSKLLAFIGSSLKRFINRQQISPTQHTTINNENLQKNIAFNFPDTIFNKDLTSNVSLNTKDHLPQFFATDSMFRKLNEKYGIYQNEKWYVVMISDLLLFWIEKRAIINFESIPQMVSWPFNVKKKYPTLEQFKQISGIELDQLDSNTLVLRSLPSYLKDFDYQKIIQHLLGLNSLPATQLEYLLALRSVMPVFNQSSDFINNIIAQFQLDELTQHPFIKQLDGRLLDKIFTK
jgi:DNA mismatch repair protein MutL